MVADDAWGLRIAVIAGVFVLGLVGVAVHWYLGRREEQEEREEQERRDRRTPPTAPAERPAR